MPIKWPTIDLTSKTTQQGLLSLGTGVATVIGGAFGLMAAAKMHPVGFGIVASVMGLIVTAATTQKALVGFQQGDPDRTLAKTPTGDTEMVGAHPVPNNPKDKAVVK